MTIIRAGIIIAIVMTLRGERDGMVGAFDVLGSYGTLWRIWYRVTTASLTSGVTEAIIAAIATIQH